MSDAPYRDLIWDVSVDLTSGELTFSTYDTEEELCALDAGGRRTEHPLEMMGLLRFLLRAQSSDQPIWTRRRIDRAEAKQLGHDLWDALPEEALAPLEEPPGDGRPLRIKVSSSVPGVADLPWELLSDEEGTPIGLRPEIRVVRSVPVRYPLPALSVDPPLRVLLVVTNPKDERFVEMGQEVRAVSRRLEGDGYELHVSEATTVELLAETLRNEPFHVLHYVGHAGLSAGEGNLIVEGADHRSHWIAASELALLIPSSVRLLCLSTCFTTENYEIRGLSHLARSPSLVQLPTAVANQYPVGEDAVSAFWDAFYSGLLERSGDANEAVQLGRVAAAAAEPSYADWASFSLVVRDQTGVPFAIGTPAGAEARVATELQAQFASRLANELAEQVQVFEGEAPSGLVEQYQVEAERAESLLDELGETHG